MFILRFSYHILRIVLRTILEFNASKNKTFELITQFETKHQGKFTESAIQKAARFQGVQQLFINDAFANLVNRNTNYFERQSNKLYFILTGLYDDIIDQKILTTKELDELFSNPLSNSNDLFEKKILVDIHLQLLKRTNHPKKYTTTLTKIHQAQKDSTKQFNAQISQEDLLDLTLRKGGYSLLMCRHYIDLPSSESLDNCWYQLGGIIQFTNDIFDIYKDIQEGIYTYPNSSTNFHQLKYCFDNLVNKLKENIHKLPFSDSKKEILLIQLSIIPAFGYIGLENLSKLQNDQGGLPKFNEVKRKQLIIDMEKTSNRFKLIRYAYTIAKSN